MKSLSFERFFEGCTFKISLSFKNEWLFKRDSCQFAYHSSYLDDDFLRDTFNVVKEDSLVLSTRAEGA